MLPSHTADTELASIRLVATDMDLTLLHTDKSMPAGVPERISKLAELGIAFCAASGRPAPSLRQEFAGAADKMAFICDNGATVYAPDGQTIYRDLIEHPLYHEVLARCTDSGVGVPVLCAFDEAYMLERDRAHHDVTSIYYRNINYVESFDALDIDSNKISIYFPGWNSPEQCAEVYEPAFSSRLYVTCAGKEWIDFMNLGVNKGSGIRRLADWLDIDLADVAAFGDTHNDIPLLDIVGHSFLVANADEHMHAHARYLAPSNEDEGVLTVLDAIIAAHGR